MPTTKKIETKLDFWIAESVKEKNFEDAFEIEEEMTSGPFGTTLKCKPKGRKDRYCVKVIRKNKEKRLVERELSLLLKLKHQNVDRIVDVFESTHDLYIITELLTGGEVLERLVKKKSYNERDVAKALKQILEGLKYIHEEELVHGNLKPENLLYQNHNEDSLIKITDVALHTILDKDLLKHITSDAIQYCAPEKLRNEVNNPASDIWSIGAIAFTMLCGEEPFVAENTEELYKKVIKGEYNSSSQSFQRLSTNAKDFIMKLLEVDPKKRPTVQQILYNQWLLGKATKIENIPLEGLRFLVNKKRTKAFLNKQALKSQYNKPSMSQKYLPKEVWLWLQKTTKYGTSLIDCVNSGVENPDSSVGLYAPDPDCYDTFPEIFWPVISEYHKVDLNELKSLNDFGDPKLLPDFDLKYNESIISTRIRVARTLEGYPMVPKLSREAREEVKELMLDAFKNLNDDLYGDFFNLNELSDEEKENLIRNHYLYADADDRYLKSAGGYKDWPLNRGIYINRSKTFVIWVNEEDHVRIISIQKGSNVKQVYERLVRGIKILEKKLKFVHHEKFGYLTFCPTNIGTGLRASVLVKLPKLAALGKLNQFCESLNLQARGFHGEHSDSPDGIYDISNKIRIGQTEFDLVNSMCNGIKYLLDEEFKIK